MAIEVRLPELAASMTEGTVAAWHKRVGDWVKPGDLLADIETDKSTVELEASEEGRLGAILVPEGTEDVPVGTVIAVLLAEGEELGETGAAGPACPEAGAADATPAAAPTAPRRRPAETEEAVRAGERRRGPASAAPPSAPPRATERPRSTPLARRMAEQSGLDLLGIRGSGVGGRIVKADVEAALEEAYGARSPSRQTPPSQRPALEEEGAFHDIRHSTARRTIAQRLSHSKRTVPHFYLSRSCDAERLLELRSSLNQRMADEGEDSRLSLNDFVVRAIALALRRVPRANVSWTDEALRVHERIDLSVAVATPQGLVAPVVRGADRLGIGEISSRLRDLAQRAREGRLSPEDYQGGTFTVSNLGMYGVETLYPIVNPPQSAILGVGAVEPRVLAHEGRPAVRSVMSCTLSCDHRAIDGSVGAELLAAFRTLIQDPVRMLL